MASISFESYVNTSLKALQNCELDAEFKFLMPKVYSAYAKIFGAIKKVRKEQTLNSLEHNTLMKLEKNLKSTLNLSKSDLSSLNEPFYNNLLLMSDYFKKDSDVARKLSKMKYDVPNYSFRILELVSQGNSVLESTVLASSEKSPSGINQETLYNDIMLSCLKQVEGIKQSCIKVQQQHQVSKTTNQNSIPAKNIAASEAKEVSKPKGTNLGPKI